MGTMRHHERRYLLGGKVAHAIASADLDWAAEGGGGCWAAAACGTNPSWAHPWLGSGSQQERERAASLPLCKKCDKAVPA